MSRKESLRRQNLAWYRRLMSDSWRISDLPEELQKELSSRLAGAKRGEDLVDIEVALSEANKTTEEILAIIANSRVAS